MSPPTVRPLAEVLFRLIGPAVARRGDHSRRPWWRCPLGTHADENPSFTIVHGKEKWRCFGCGATGDGIDLARFLNPAAGFREAVAIAGGSQSARSRGPASVHHGRSAPPTIDRPEPAPRPAGWPEFIQRVVAEAEAALWSDAGAKPLGYLRGRGLNDATIRAARLGYWTADSFHRGLYADKPLSIPRGVVIPWIEGAAVEAVNIRRPVPSRAGGTGPHERKYHLLRGSRRTIYPGRSAIVPGRSLILSEGEFDRMLLGQELRELALVVTLGSASDRRPGPMILLAMSTATPWYLAGDADGAGVNAAGDWLARSGRCRRVEPPEPFKDWTEAHQDGIDLRSWWGEVLAGRPVERFDPAWYDDLPESTAPAPLHDPGGIDLMSDVWRWEVANWPHKDWSRWRRRAGEILPATATPTVAEIKAAEHLAYLEIARPMATTR